MKKQGRVMDYLKLARLDHWIKQLFILPGIVFGIALIYADVVPSEIISKFFFAFFATCLIASANYIINEWLDAEFDKYHPTKKHRTAVVASLKRGGVITLYAIFAVLGLVAAYLASFQIFLCNLLLLIMGILYNVKPFRTKEIVYLDVLSESINNAIRLMIGWFIVTSVYLPPVTIVFGYWMGGAFLMATKRYAEYNMIDNKETAALYRKSFQSYSSETLLISAFFYALSSVFFSGVFMIKYRVELLLAIPPLCGLFCYYLYISYKHDSAVQKPEKLFKEKGLMIYVGLLIVLFGVLMLVRIPALDVLIENVLIEVRL